MKHPARLCHALAFVTLCGIVAGCVNTQKIEKTYALFLAGNACDRTQWQSVPEYKVAAFEPQIVVSEPVVHWDEAYCFTSRIWLESSDESGIDNSDAGYGTNLNLRVRAQGLFVSTPNTATSAVYRIIGGTNEIVRTLLAKHHSDTHHVYFHLADDRQGRNPARRFEFSAHHGTRPGYWVEGEISVFMETGLVQWDAEPSDTDYWYGYMPLYFSYTDFRFAQKRGCIGQDSTPEFIPKRVCIGIVFVRTLKAGIHRVEANPDIK